MAVYCIEWVPSEEQVNDLRKRIYMGDPSMQQFRLVPPVGEYIGANTFLHRMDAVLFEACQSLNAGDLVEKMLPYYLNYFDINKLIYCVPEEEKQLETVDDGKVHPVSLKYSHFKKSLTQANTLMHAAAKGGNTEIVVLLLASGANVDVVNCCSQTPLTVAILHGRYSTASLLIDSKADVCCHDNDNMTPLMHIARTGHSELAVHLISQLLEAGADPLDADSYGYTAFHHAAVERNHLTLKELLKEVPLVQGIHIVGGALRIGKGPMLYVVVDNVLLREHDDLIRPLLPTERDITNKVNALFLFASYFIESNLQKCIGLMREAIAVGRVVNYEGPQPDPVFGFRKVPTKMQDLEDILRKKSYEEELKYFSMIIQDYSDRYASLNLIESLFTFAKKIINSHKFHHFMEALLLFQRGFEIISLKTESSHILELPHLGRVIIKGLKMIGTFLSRIEGALVDSEIFLKTVAEFIKNCLLTTTQYLLYYSAVMSSKHFHFPRMFVVEEIMASIMNVLEQTFDIKRRWKLDSELSLDDVGKDLVMLCSPIYEGGAFFKVFLHKVVLESFDAYHSHHLVLKSLLNWGASDFVDSYDQFGQRLLHKAKRANIKALLLVNGAHEDTASLTYSANQSYHIFMPKIFWDPLPLQCLCAQAISEHNIAYEKYLPVRVTKFVALHDSKAVKRGLESCVSL